MTGKGGQLARHMKNFDYIESRPAWKKLSKHSAKDAEGDVHVFLTRAAKADADNIYSSVERPILSSNPKVNLIEHIID